MVSVASNHAHGAALAARHLAELGHRRVGLILSRFLRTSRKFWPAGGQEAVERQHAVAATLASVRAEGLEPSAEDLTLFAEVAAGSLSTNELQQRVLSRYRR